MKIIKTKTEFQNYLFIQAGKLWKELVIDNPEFDGEKIAVDVSCDDIVGRSEIVITLYNAKNIWEVGIK